jgi:predicted kinase
MEMPVKTESTNVHPPRLYVFSGLPGTGKTTLSRMLSQWLSAPHIRVDTLEQAMRNAGLTGITHEGYDVAYQLASDQLALGFSVVADSCNPIRVTREAWQTVAIKPAAAYTNIEVICSNLSAHRQRVASRISDIEGLILPTWEQVIGREYEVWTSDVVRIDTGDATIEQAFQDLLKQLALTGHVSSI